MLIISTHKIKSFKSSKAIHLSNMLLNIKPRSDIYDIYGWSIFKKENKINGDIKHFIKTANKILCRM